MSTTKSWYQSTTLWGIIIAFIGFGLQKWGVDTSSLNIPPNADAETIKGIVTQIQAAHGSVLGIISVLVSAIGSLVAIFGRLKAKTTLTA
jgi:hypothetical protein